MHKRSRIDVAVTDRHVAGLVLALLVLLGAVRCGSGSPTSPTGPGSPAVPPISPVPLPPPVPGAPQVFVGAGDIAMCDANSESTARLLDSIGGTVFALGDNAYFSGTRQEYRDCYGPTWGRHRDRTRPVPGNHDYQSSGAAPYFEYFGANAGPAQRGYYSFEIGSWHAVALDSNIPVDAASAQAAWLRGDLAASRARCTVAYWHHPLFTSGPNGDQTRMRDFWRILYDAGADLILSGHDHLYERFAPQDADGRADPTRGLRQFIVGTGGAFLYQPVTVRTNSEVRAAAFGVLKLTLAADSYQWEFVGVPGLGDSGSASCH